jgi:hypothetical protein
VKNPRRAYDKEGNEFVPLNLAVMREHGCHTVMVECRRCGHNAIVNVDALEGAVPVPDVAMVWTKLVCSQCAPEARR